MSSDLLLELYADHPELFQLVKQGSRNILKIISSKFKEKSVQLKEWHKNKKKKKELDNLIPILSSSEIESYLELIGINEQKKNNVIRKHLDASYWSVYLLGRKAQDKALSTAMDAILDIKNSARAIKGSAGIHMVNIIMKGYFDDIFIPLLNFQIKNLSSDSKVTAWFISFCDRMLIFFPRAIWVANSTTSFLIKNDLIKRCVSNKFKVVNIHTIGEINIDKVEKVFTDLSTDEDFPDFNHKMNYEVEELNAVTFVLTIV